MSSFISRLRNSRGIPSRPLQCRSGEGAPGPAIRDQIPLDVGVAASMRASSQRKRTDQSRPALNLAPSSQADEDLNAHVTGQGTLRRIRPRLIIGDERLDREAEAPIGGRDLIRRGTSSNVDVWSLPAMLNHERAIERSLAPTDATSSITLLLADLRAGRREAFDQILPLVYHELRRA